MYFFLNYVKACAITVDKNDFQIYNLGNTSLIMDQQIPFYKNKRPKLSNVLI